MILRFILLCGLFVSLSSSAWALPSLSPRLRDKQVRVGLLTNTYLTKVNPSIADQGTGNMGLNIGVRGIGNKGDIHFGLEADSLYGLRNANYRYIDISEAYLGYARDGYFAYAGRKRFEWSSMDSYWGLGLFQPRFRWDYLNERENGLFGFFIGHKNDVISTTAYVSPIFIPEQGAPFDIDGGSCKTSSPWFNCPASSISLFNQPTDVRFALEIPPVRKLIAHWGAGATVRIGRELGPFGRAALTHKPINQFLLSYEGRLDLSTLQIPAVIRPRVLYHDLFGFDLGWNLPRHAAVVSALWEKPRRDATPASWNTQETYDAFLTSLVLKTMPLEGSFKHTRFEISYFHRDGGNGRDKGPFAQPNSNVFEPRYALRSAFALGVFTPIFDDWARSLLFSTKFLVDTANEGNILQADFLYRPVARLFLNLGLDMLGSNSRSPVDFISRYQRNDRVRFGISYVF
jgi:hypothetical protein